MDDRADVAEERSKFEAWCNEPARRMTLGILVKYRVVNTASGYVHSEVIQAWEAWQGRAAISSAVPDGGKGSETSSREAVAHVVVRRDVDGDQYISVAWTGKPPSNGTKLFTAPQAECGKSSGEAVGEITHSSFEGWYFHPYINWPEIGDGTKLYATPQNSADIDAMRLGNEHLNALRFIATTTWPEESPVGKRLSEVIAAIDAELQAKEPNRAERKLAAEARLVAALQAKGVAE